MGLGGSLITFVPNTIVKSGDVNSNLSALNNASTPSFSTITVSGVSSLDSAKIITDGAGTLKLVNSAGGLLWNAARSGTNRSVIRITPTDTSAKAWGLYTNTDESLRFYNITDNITSLIITATGNVIAANLLQQGSANVAISGSHSLGQTIVSYGNGAPAALAANEVYFQLT